MINTFLRIVEAGTVHNQRQLTVHLIFRPFWIFLPVRSRNKETKKNREFQDYKSKLWHCSLCI